MRENRKKPVKTKITSVVEVTYIVNDCELIPNREVKEFWTIDGRKIGQFDFLDELSLVIDKDCSVKYSKDKK